MPRTLLLVLLTALALTGPAGAALASGRDVLDDCTADEVMSKTYTQKEYRDALSQLAGDTDQYGNCRDVIKRAQLKAAAGDAGSRKQGGSTPVAPAGGGPSAPSGGSGAIGSAPAREQLQAATPTERRAVQQARTTNDAVRLDNARVDARKAGTVPGVSRVSDLPAPLVVVVALLLAAALALAVLRLRSLVHARRA